jgi:hypothetical protein
MSCTLYDAVVPNALNKQYVTAFGDDTYINLDAFVGKAVQNIYFTKLDIGLNSSNILADTNYTLIENGANENVFAEGHVCGWIPSQVTDGLNRGRYAVVLRIQNIDGRIKTFKTTIVIDLTNRL